MNDLGNLLQMIYDLLSGWFTSFTSHATAVMKKLNLIEDDTDTIVSNTSDIADDTNDIKDNTGAIITPVQSIKTNTDSIKTDTTTIKNNVSTMSNQLGTISTNVGTASAFTEDVANNTLDIKNRIVTIGSDTTQLRSNSNTITSDVSDIKTALNYYLANTPVTEDVEGSICNIDTDLTDYLQACKVTIPADLSGFSGITLTKCGKNLSVIKEKGRTNNGVTYVVNSDSTIIISGTALGSSYAFSVITDINKMFYLKKGKYTLSGGISNNFRLYIGGRYIDGTAVTNSSLVSGTIYDKGSGAMFELPMDAYIYLQISVTEGTQTDVTIYPQIEVGTTKTEFEIHKETYNSISFGTTITDGAEINLLDGIIKVNSTPVSYLSISPIAVRTYKGVNNIYSDVGTTALTYRETLKHYIDKQEA